MYVCNLLFLNVCFYCFRCTFRLVRENRRDIGDKWETQHVSVNMSVRRGCVVLWRPTFASKIIDLSPLKIANMELLVSVLLCLSIADTWVLATPGGGCKEGATLEERLRRAEIAFHGVFIPNERKVRNNIKTIT